jgi:fatty acid desaturase
MHRMNRDGLVRMCAILVAALVVAFVCWTAVGGVSGILFAIAIGTAVAVAIFGGTQRGCSPSFLRRRED